MGMNVTRKIEIDTSPSNLCMVPNSSVSSNKGAVLKPTNAIITAQKNQPVQKYPNGNNARKKRRPVHLCCFGDNAKTICPPSN